MRVGRTIAEERERIESESDRLAARELSKRREAIQTAIFVVAIVAMGILGVVSVKSLIGRGGNSGSSDDTGGDKVYAPSVPVIDESGSQLSRKMSEFIGMVEADFRELGASVTRVAVPTGMAREVDVYIDKGEGELPYYFKMNIDRGSAVSAEDAWRMVAYLSERELKPSYVDVRVEGKAYYR